MRNFFSIFFILPFVLFFARNETFMKFFLRHAGQGHFLTGLDHLIVVPAVLLFILAAAYSAGSLILLQFLKLRELDWAEEFIFSAALGLGLISFIVLGAGLMGWMSASFYWAMLLALFASGFVNFRHWGARAGSSLRSHEWDFNWVEIASVNLVLWVMLHGFFTALAPPTFIDVLSYHLGNAAQYLRHGKIFLMPGNLSGALPGNLEMLYVLGLAIKGEALAQLLSLVLSAFLAISVLLYGVRFFGSRGVGFLGAAILCAQPVFSSFVGTAMQDLGTAFYIFASVYALSLWRDKRGGAHLALCGIFAGLALGTKYLAIPFVAAIGAAVVSLQLIDRQFRFRDFFLFIFFLALFSAPWYLRNYLWTRNPFYPLFYGVFGGQYMSAELALQLTRLEIPPGQNSVFVRWLMTLYGMVTDLRFGYYYNPEYFTWPFLMLLGPLALRRPKLRWFMALFAALALAGSFALSGRTSFWRYFLPAMPGLCLLFAWSAMEVSHYSKKVFAAVLFLMLLAVVRLDQDLELFPVLGYAASHAYPQDARESYLAKKLDYYPLYERARKNLPSDAKVGMVEMPDNYNLRRDYHFVHPLFQGLIPFDKIASSEELARELQANGVTYLCVNAKSIGIVEPWQLATLPPWFARGQELVRVLLETRAVRVDAEGDYALYQLNQIQDGKML